MCENRVDETLQGMRPSLMACSFLARTSQVQMTSWYPQFMQPPVIHSNCFPACRRRWPSGTDTENFQPVLSQANSPGYLDLPWMVRKLKSQWNPAKTVPTLQRARSLPVGASLCGPRFISEEKVLRYSPSPTAAISATVSHPLIMCFPQAQTVSLNSGKSLGTLFWAMSSMTSPMLQKYLHLASKGGGEGVSALFPLTQAAVTSLRSLAFQAYSGVAPTWKSNQGKMSGTGRPAQNYLDLFQKKRSIRSRNLLFWSALTLGSLMMRQPYFLRAQATVLQS